MPVILILGLVALGAWGLAKLGGRRRPVIDLALLTQGQILDLFDQAQRQGDGAMTQRIVNLHPEWFTPTE